MKIRIVKRSLSEWLIWFVAVFPFVCQFLIDVCSFPSAFKYLIDISLIALVITSFPKVKNIMEIQLVFLWIATFFTYTFVGFLMSYQSIIYYLWGLRNNFRFYIFFLMCVMILKKRDIEIFLKVFDVFFIMNIIMVSFQYWVLGIKQDNLGGFFGTASGCNGYMNIFLIIVLSKAVLTYLNRKEKLSYCLTIAGFTVYIAALAELKFYFVEMLMVVAISILITDFSWRKLTLVLGSLVLLIIGVSALVTIFPNWSGVFTIQGMLEIGMSKKGYTGSGDLNRLTGISTLATNYLTSKKEILMGLGLGNCDYSDSFTFLQTPFYRTHGWLHYTWMSSTFIFVEMGLIGLMFFFGFFTVTFFGARKRTEKLGEFKIAGQLGQVVSVLCMIIGIYNGSLRMESGYMAYLVLALPFINEREKIS